MDTQNAKTILALLEQAREEIVVNHTKWLLEGLDLMDNPELPQEIKDIMAAAAMRKTLENIAILAEMDDRINGLKLIIGLAYLVE